MTLKDKKAYDLLVLKLEHIYLGATGSICNVDEIVWMDKDDAGRIVNAIFTLISEDDNKWELAKEFNDRYNEFGSAIDDIENVADWLFEKGVR